MQDKSFLQTEVSLSFKVQGWTTRTHVLFGPEASITGCPPEMDASPENRLDDETIGELGRIITSPVRNALIQLHVKTVLPESGGKLPAVQGPVA